jgi:TolB-like protein/tetratricopeptide (TPR) repeat protein
MNLTGMKKWALALAAVVIAGAVVFTLNHYPHAISPPSDGEAVPGKPERARVFLGPANSIAVLPFTGVQDDQEQAFWAYGFSTELHRLTTRAPGLRVTSENSSFFFLGQSVPMPIIAERLQARYLLSGEMLVVDGRVQVNATLYDAKKKVAAWSRDFEGDLGDVFLIQDQILADTVESVVPQRQDELPKFRPVNVEAWTAYLKGLFSRAQKTEAGFEAAGQAFLTALGIEPGFAMARVSLAGLWLEMRAFGQGDASLVENARQALDAALQAEPELPEALGLLSYIRRNEDWNWQGAREAALAAVRLNPGDPELMSTASLAMFSLGQFDEAGDLLKNSVSQDPLNLARRLQLGLLQEFAGRNDEALTNYRVIVGLNPDFPGVRAFRARVKIIQDNAESALKESEQEVDPFWKRYSQILAYSALGRDDEAQRLLDRMITEDGEHSAYQIAEIMAFRGETGLAFEWLQRAYEQKDGGMSEMIGNYFLGNLHADPRWAEFLIRLGLPPSPPVD